MHDMQIELRISPDDDIEILEAIKEHARICRRRGTPQAALTASKVELLFSKAIDSINSPTASEDAK